jgi:hypothetical protein
VRVSFDGEAEGALQPPREGRGAAVAQVHAADGERIAAVDQRPRRRRRDTGAARQAVALAGTAGVATAGSAEQRDVAAMAEGLARVGAVLRVGNAVGLLEKAVENLACQVDRPEMAVAEAADLPWLPLPRDIGNTVASEKEELFHF